MRAPNVLTISPALPFLDTFVAAFLRGEVVQGFLQSADPLALAGATIYVPTRRAAAALRAAFLAQAKSPSLLPPRILSLGALEATETELFLALDDPVAAGLPLPAAASPIWRRLQLASLIQAWARAVKGALRWVGPGGEPVVEATESFAVATSSVDAFALAGDLARLIDEMAIEAVDWAALDALDMGAFDPYWRLTTTFLQIAVEQWPRILGEHGLVDPAKRQIALVDAQARRLAEGGTAGPTVAIGSTGSNKATARLLAAIARAPGGAVVLPGLDLDLDAAAFALAAGGQGPGQEPSHGHPQAAMARLLGVLGVVRTDVRQLGLPEQTRADRARLVAEALRPADTTDLWRSYRRKVAQKTIAAALAGVALIEAADDREEALCLAIALREALETPGRTAALVTPDRELARRVRGELTRWNIEIADTGGEPLASRPLGVLARLVAAAGAGARPARELLALLGHPLVTFGRPRSEVARLAALLEIGVLRVVMLGDHDADTLFTAAREAADDRHAHPAQRSISDGDWAAMKALWIDVAARLAPLAVLRDGMHPLDRWVSAHRAALAAIVAPADEAESALLDELFDEMQAGPPLDFDATAYADLFGRLATEASMRTSAHPHPRLAIYGLLEARLLPADTLLLGGLDETIWPPQAHSDPFLNRPMRAALGLSPPERRIGQTAHDFSQAMGHRTVVLSRARKRGGAPTVASRFLLRLAALSGKPWDEVVARGREYVELAHALDRPPTRPKPAARPVPKPPVALRPNRLSVTQIETLRRDPYAIFAARVLGLAPMPQVGVAQGGDIDPSAYGSAFHDALHDFCRSPEAGGAPPTRRERLAGILREAFAEQLKDPTFQAFRWRTIEKSMDVFLDYDAGQRSDVREIVTETSGALDLPLADGTSFKLSARADRIDYHRTGRATLIDYKTGQPPTAKEVQVGFAPQLTLEAAMLRRGAFDRAHAGEIAATYVKLGGRDGGRIVALKFEGATFDDVVERHYQGALRLLSSFRHDETGYPSRPFPKYAKSYGTYDHLARVREWSLAAEEEDAP